jgi:hypothetical protein
MLYNMMVVEQIHGNDDSIEDASFYDMVMDTKVGGNALADDEATQLVNMQEENIARQLLEVEYLEMLGIQVHDSLLCDDMGRVSILPQLTHMAQFQWTELYDMASHQRVKNAIMNELE